MSSGTVCLLFSLGNNGADTGRLLDFEETQIYLKLERTSIPTSRRSKSKEVSHIVKKTTTVLDIKVEVSHPPSSRRPPHAPRRQAET